MSPIRQNFSTRSRTDHGVTVVIPTFNRKDWLRVAIESVLVETRIPLTVHVFDNASSDGTMDYMKSLESTHENVIYTRNAENIGAVRNFVQALDSVSTRYFVPLADDDFLLSDFLHDAYRLLDGDPRLGAAIFVTEARGEDNTVRNTYPRGRENVQPGLMEPARHLRSWIGNGHYSWSSILWRSEALDFVGYPYLRTGLPSDVDFQVQVFSKYPAYYVDTPGAVYRLHKEQAGGNIDVSTVLSWAKLFRRLDRTVIDQAVLPREEYAKLRTLMSERYRVLWRRPSKLPLSDRELERTAFAAGFDLGDWEFAFSLLDKMSEQSVGPPPRLLQLPALPTPQSEPTGGGGMYLYQRLMPGILSRIRDTQRALENQTHEINQLRARCTELEDEIVQQSLAPPRSPSGLRALIRNQIKRAIARGSP